MYSRTKFSRAETIGKMVSKTDCRLSPGLSLPVDRMKFR
jgi:hypothetical protein